MTVDAVVRLVVSARHEVVRLAAVLALPLLLAAGTALPEPGSALLGLALALLVALAVDSRGVLAALHVRPVVAVAGRPTPTSSSRIPDPVRHPVRPRAPGQV